jgi:hypothetical protein
MSFKKCKICNKKFINIDILIKHVKTVHHLKSKEYYDKFYKKPGDGFCVYCKKTPLPYYTFSKGYRKVCGKRKCKIKHTEYAGLLAARKIKEKYGVSCPMHVDKFKKKMEQTNLSRYGIKYPVSLKTTREKMEKTNIERYGSKCVFSNKKIIKKIAKSVFEKYGVDNVMYSEKVKNKLKKSCIEKYGVPIASQNKKIIAKFKKTMLERYGYIGGFQNKDVMNRCVKITRKNKEESGEWVKKEDVPDYKKYKYLVYKYTRIAKNKKYSKKQLKNIGKMGNTNKKQIDHIFSIKDGFENGIPPWIIGSAVNLRLIHWKKNLLKKTNSEISKNELISLFYEHVKNDY